MSELDGTMECCFDLKKSRNDWRIWVLVMLKVSGKSQAKRLAEFRVASELDFSPAREAERPARLEFLRAERKKKL